MRFTTVDDACQKLRSMGEQFICPKDEFFGPLADAIEALRQRATDAETVIDSINNLRDAAYEEIKGERNTARSALERVQPVLKALEWYMGARVVNEEEAARASQLVLKEFETWRDAQAGA